MRRGMNILDSLIIEINCLERTLGVLALTRGQFDPLS